MFRETLLDSSPHRHNSKRWPMAIAFVLESAIGAVIISVPLLSTGVIPVSARVPRIAPLQVVRVAGEPASELTGRGIGQASITNIVTLPGHQGMVHFGRARQAGDYETAGPNLPVAPGGSGPNMVICTECQPLLQPPVHKKPLVVSQLSPAQLVDRVEPLYPRAAVLINLQGEVKLHAIIAKDGTIQSLSVTSGHPMLAQAALDAVRQWRYHPYVLNGEAVEVETFITVNFRREH